MAEAKITITGDSKDAVSSINDATKSITKMDSSIDDVTESAGKLSSASSSTSSSLGRLTGAAKGAGSAAGSASSALGGLGGALGKVSPAAGAAASAMGSLAGGVGSLTSLMTPAGLAAAALGLSLGVAVKQFNAAKQAAAAAASEMARYETSIYRVRKELAELRAPTIDLGAAVATVAAGSEEAAAAVKDYQDSFKRTDAIEAAEAIQVAYEDLEATHLTNVATLDDLNKRLAENERQLEGATKNASAGAIAARDWKGRVDSLTDTNRRLKLSVEKVSVSVESSGAALKAAKREYDAAKAGVEGLLTPLGEVATLTSGGSFKALAVDFSGIADAMIKAAVSSGDFATVMDSLGDGDLGASLVGAFEGISDEVLATYGISADQLANLREQEAILQSGRDLLQEQATAKQQAFDLDRADYELAVQKNEAALAFADEEYARSQEMRAAQQAAIERAGMSTAELQEAERAHTEWMREQIQAKIELGALLNAQELEFIEEQGNAQREIVDSLEESMAALKESMGSLGIGAVTDSLGDFSSAFGEAAASGEDMGDALGKSGKKAVANIAKQYGGLFMSMGMGMLFVPGQQAQGAGLVAAGAALLAIGGAVGASAKKSGSDGGGGGPQENNSTQTVVVDTYERASPGVRARDTGSAEDNADRYGIDRGSEWA